MPDPWTRQAAAYLTDETRCPSCGNRREASGPCRSCFADLDGPVAQQVRAASAAAADALLRREALIEGMPRLAPIAPPAAPAVAQAPAAVIPAPAAAVAAPADSLSVQSVLAVAGAGLVAVAAFVFTFLNPDLTDFRTRTLVVGVITVIFLGSAWLLSRRGLKFSAEAVGGLGIVFLALDVWAFSELAPTRESSLLYAAIATAGASLAVVALGALTRTRSWLWAGLVGVAVTPMLFGLAAGGDWGSVLGWLATAAIVLLVHEVVRRLRGRLDSPLNADRTTATIIQAVATVVVLAQLPWLPWQTQADRVIVVAVLLLALAALAVLATRHQAVIMWSFVAGGFAACAIAVLPLGASAVEWPWYLALIPAAAAIPLMLLAWLRRTGTVHRDALLGGAWTIVLATAIPATMFAAMSVLSLPLIEPAASNIPQLGGALGLAAVAAGSAGLAALRARGSSGLPTLARSARVVAAWFAALTLLALPAWSALLRPTQAVIALVFSLAIAASLAFVTRIAASPIVLRTPLLVVGHGLVLLAGVISWVDDALTVPVGVAIVAIIVALSRAMPRPLAPLYVGTAYAYALIVLANALVRADLDLIAVLCLVTTAGSLFALAATLTKVLPASSWQAVLVVTAVPFLIGVGSVVGVRSGWTGLSTFVTFLLALTLLFTQRTGLNRIVRTAAAMILVPALAVVVICVGAQVLEVSGSPATLTVIAVIVGLVLPSTIAIGNLLVKRGQDAPTARAARLAIEASTLLTAVIAVLLALVREAAGLSTALVVLLILAGGFAATARFARRRYAWPLAGAALTGALWCVLGLADIAVVEAYLLPPALGAALIGAIMEARRRVGFEVYATGLFFAVGLVVVMLVVQESQSGVPVRALALLAGAAVLAAAGFVLTRWPDARGVRSVVKLRWPTLAAAMLAASGAAVQGIRLGWERDELFPGTAVMIPVLVFAAAGAVIAAIAAHLLSSGAEPDSAFARSRWLFAPAALILAVGPITAIRVDALSILALWLLMALLLVVMIVTVVRAGTRAVALPPVWFIFALAWCVAVAGWSARELRVEAFSLPLGFALLAAGIIAMRQRRDALPASFHSPLTRWPNGASGSWRLLAPGIGVVFAASVASTGTDPQTWRAILVIGLALVAILLGALLKLAAPFIIGIIVLPIENLVVFAVQIGRNIGALPWWITLATAGAVLLVIAVTSERKTGGDRSVAARLRDLT